MLPIPTANKLLSTLPLADRQRISSYLTTVPAKFKQVFYKQGGTIHDVYFPCSGAWSLTKTMEDGVTAEVGTIGNEGMIGCSVFFGDHQAPSEANVQIAGDVDPYKMPVAAFMAEMELRARVSGHHARRSAPDGDHNRSHVAESWTYQQRHRGVINITDRKGLEAASCECYVTVKTNFARLLPEIPPTG